MWIYMSQKKTEGTPQFFGEHSSRSVGVGLGVGAALGVLAIGYLKLSAQYGWFDVPDQATASSTGLAVILLAVLAAPIFEEYIFRGLVFQGLKRNLPLVVSVLGSGLIFAAVHPLVSFVPVLLLGMTTSMLYHKTKSLLASIVTHAVYNAIVLAIPFFWPLVIK